jgi:hypothetical protein
MLPTSIAVDLLLVPADDQEPHLVLQPSEGHETSVTDDDDDFLDLASRAPGCVSR